MGAQANQQIALAQNFTDNSFDFFHPREYSFNHGSSYWDKMSSTTISATHFPIHSYLPALVSYAFGLKLSAVFHYYVLLFGAVGLYFLFMLALRFTNHVGKSLFVVIFIASTPLFIAFHGNTTNTIPIVALVLAGVYYFFKAEDGRTVRYSLLALGFLTAAAMSSPNVLFILIVALIFTVPRLLKSELSRGRVALLVLAFLAPLLLDYSYFWYLQGQYGSNSIFLFEDWGLWAKYPKKIERSSFRYFTWTHVVIFGLSIVFFVTSNRTKFSQRDSMLQRGFSFLLYTATFALVLCVLMPQKMVNDRAFLLEIALIPFVLLLLYLLQNLNFDFSKKYQKFHSPILVVLLIALMAEGNRAQFEEKATLERLNQSALIINFLGAEEMLHLYGVPKDARIAIIIPIDQEITQEYFIQMNRKGCFIHQFDFNEDLFQSCDYFVVSQAFPRRYWEWNPNYDDKQIIIIDNQGIVVGKIAGGIEAGAKARPIYH